MSLTSLIMLLPIFGDLSPFVKMGIGALAPDIDNSDSAKQSVLLLDMLAKSEGVPVEEFVRSGRALEVLKAKVLNKPVPKPGSNTNYRLAAEDVDGERSYKIIKE